MLSKSFFSWPFDLAVAFPETRDQRKCCEGSVSKELPQQSNVPASEVRDDVLDGESHQSVLAPNRSCCKDLFPEELQQKSPADLGK